MLFFLDESGQDRGACPYEVIGGIAVREPHAWSLISDIHDSQVRNFGTTLDAFVVETKGTKFLKSKTFRLASQLPKIPEDERRELAFRLLRKGASARSSGLSDSNPSKAELTAYAQSALEYVRDIFAACERRGVRSFAVCIHPKAPRDKTGRERGMLGKEFSSLFKIAYYVVDSISPDEHALLVFDEVENSESRRFITRTRNYFRKTVVGKALSSRILPDPLFVHSDLTLLVQVADIVCYSLNWGYRRGRMDGPVREEMRYFGESAARLLWRESDEDVEALKALKYTYTGFAYFDDLRPAMLRNSDFSLEDSEEPKRKGNAYAMPPSTY